MPRILLVEDELELRLALALRLRAAGFSCELAANGQEGLAQVDKQRPELIIADLLMPVMDGYTMVQRLRGDARTASIPVMVLTAVPGPRLAEQQRLPDDVRVMHKPFGSAALLAAVRELLANPHAGDRHG